MTISRLPTDTTLFPCTLNLRPRKKKKNTNADKWKSARKKPSIFIRHHLPLFFLLHVSCLYGTLWVMTDLPPCPIYTCLAWSALFYYSSAISRRNQLWPLGHPSRVLSLLFLYMFFPKSPNMPRRVVDNGASLRLVITLCARVVGLCSDPKPFSYPANACVWRSSAFLNLPWSWCRSPRCSFVFTVDVYSGSKVFHIPKMPARTDLRLFSVWPKFSLNLKQTS